MTGEVMEMYWSGFIVLLFIQYLVGVARYMYSYRTVTVQASRFGAWALTTNTGNSPPIQKGRRSNATLFDNHQQKNSECRELRAWKQSP